MKKCPYCAEEIQDAATVCRYCGRDLPAPVQPPAPSKPQQTQQVKPPKVRIPFWLFVAGSVFMMFCCGFFVTAIGANTDATPTPTTEELTAVVSNVVIKTYTPAGTKTPKPTSTPRPTATPARPTTYSTGDVVQMEDHTIVLNSASIDNNILKANFTIENTGNEAITVSSILNFTVKDGAGIKMEQKYFDCGSSLDGSVIVGDRLKGDICWSLLQGEAVPFKIYYQPNIFNADITIVWVIAP